MDGIELGKLLDRLIKNWEDETVEFKNVGDTYSTSEIGKYFSALSNEANLRDKHRAWLVFGVDNKSRKVKGSDYRTHPERLHGLKNQIADGAEPSITFHEIHVLDHSSGRVVLFEIPPAPAGIPIAWNGHYFARAGESLVALGLDKLDSIRAQSRGADWTARIVPSANYEDLDPDALKKARELFAGKHANRFRPEEVMGWPDPVFLDRAKLALNGKLTRAALLLVGKETSKHHLSPHPAEITWKLVDHERGYRHFYPPFLLATGLLYQKIRNVQLRILPESQLVPVEVAKYDQKIVLEALHNCIAHQDYSRNARILVTEFPDRLEFINDGAFFEGSPQDYMEGSRTPRQYRNPQLAQAMVELNMIDTMGYGIHQMFRGQAKRFFPLPDFNLAETNCVQLILHGKIVDPAYSRLLIQKTELSLFDILALDRVQKGLPLDPVTARKLRKAGLIEGRKPHLHISARLAAATDTKASYIRTRGQDDAFYQKLILDYVEKFGSASRDELDQLLLRKFPDEFSAEQKFNKIHNLLSKLRRRGLLKNEGSKTKSKWELAAKPLPGVSKGIKGLSKKSHQNNA